MKILVVYGNDIILDKTKLLFYNQPHHWVFKKSINDFLTMPYYDIILSLHCKQIFPDWVTKNTRCINVHPGYNPYNRGMFPHVWSIVNGLPAGATIHEMDGLIDHGKILARRQVEVTEFDTSSTLYDKVLSAEVELLEENLEGILDGSIQGFQPEIDGNYNSLNDYKKLCEINPDAMTGRELYNTLRALSHNGYNNAKYNNKFLNLNILHHDRM